MKRLSIFAAFSLLACTGFRDKEQFHGDKKMATVQINNSYSSFAVLELFTSEGCSSCPSADRLLPQLATIDSNVIALSFHVDYWDYLGWKDPFSNSVFSARQREYGQHFNLESIYTPQLVINGKYELVGSNRSSAEADIRTLLKEKASVNIGVDEVKRDHNKLLVNCHLQGSWQKSNLLAAIVQKHAETNVRAGENRGARLSHTNVVRSFVRQDAKEKLNLEIPIPDDLSGSNFSLILYAQQKTDFRIIGVTMYGSN